MRLRGKAWDKETLPHVSGVPKAIWLDLPNGSVFAVSSFSGLPSAYKTILQSFSLTLCWISTVFRSISDSTDLLDSDSDLITVALFVSFAHLDMLPKSKQYPLLQKSEHSINKMENKSKATYNILCNWTILIFSTLNLERFCMFSLFSRMSSPQVFAGLPWGYVCWNCGIFEVRVFQNFRDAVFFSNALHANKIQELYLMWKQVSKRSQGL